MIKKIKSIKVKRKVVREVVVKKTFNEDVSVAPEDLTVDEIGSLPLEYARAVCVYFKRMYNECMELNKTELAALKTSCDHTPEPPLTTQPIKTEDTVNVSDEVKETATEYPHDHIGGSGIVGAKHGHTSRFHYVFFNARRKKWCNTFTNDAFTSEIACASFVNKWLDKHDNKDRPRNVIGEI